MTAPLRVNFVLQAVGKTGGVLVVLEYARRLRAAGHDVRVYYPALPHAVYFNTLPAWKIGPVRLRMACGAVVAARRDRRAAGDAELRLVPVVANAFIRDADFTIATAWPTAYDVAALAPSKGRKLYFVQGYETWNGEVEKVDASFRLPLGILTISPWLTRLVRERFGLEPVAELRNGVDLDFFRPPPEGKPDDGINLLMMHHVQAIKGISDGLHILREIKRRHPGVRIRMFGMHPFPDKDDFIEYHRDPPRDVLLSLYQNAHVFLSPGLSEGWHLPPMEAMACGCAVVATRVGCIPALVENGNLLEAEPGDRSALLGHLDTLIRDPDVLRETARKGRETILRYGWDEKAEAFERTLRALAGR